MTEKKRVRAPLFAIDLASRVVSRVLPKSLEPTVEQFRRDARRFVERLSGEPSPSFVHREPPPSAPVGPVDPTATAPAASKPYVDPLAPRPLRVSEVIRETPDAVTLRLLDPEDRPFHLVAGQFFTVCVDLNGEHLRRAYSISSVAGDQETVDLTIKRVPDGRVSTFLNRDVKSGDLLHVLGPSGNFTVRPDPALARRLVLIGGGSGVTPLLSILRTLLPAEPATQIALVYGNRAAQDVIFASAIESLAARYPDRLFVRQTLEQPPAGWTGGTGWLDGKELVRQLSTIEAWASWPHDTVEYYSCGPEPMMASCKAAALDVLHTAPTRYHEERFVNPEARVADGAVSTEALPVTLLLRGKPQTFTVQPGQSILEAGLAAGVPMPFSCAMGGCAECMVKKTSGDMMMAEPNCLTPEERAQGFVLTCVGRPKTALGLSV